MGILGNAITFSLSTLFQKSIRDKKNRVFQIKQIYSIAKRWGF
jgi:hypothetical protein